MVSRNSVSASELAKMGVCKASIRVRSGYVLSKRSSAQYRGDVEHSRFESSVKLFMGTK